jgi:hypothetical protein
MARWSSRESSAAIGVDQHHPTPQRMLLDFYDAFSMVGYLIAIFADLSILVVQLCLL